MATVLATNLIVGHQYQLANTLHIVFASPSYQQRLLARPHILLEKENTIDNSIFLIFQTDGIGQHPQFNPQIYVFENQEFIEHFTPVVSNITPSNVPAVTRKGGKRTIKRKQNRHKRKVHKRKTTNKRR